MRASDPGFDPARPVLANPLAHEPVGGAPDRLVTDPMSITVMQLFDGAYELMTTMLLRFFAHSDESDEALTTLVQSAIDLMFAAVRPLGTLLTSLPAGAEHGGATAGPRLRARPTGVTDPAPAGGMARLPRAPGGAGRLRPAPRRRGGSRRLGRGRRRAG
jgi:hypothetical protein